MKLAILALSLVNRTEELLAVYQRTVPCMDQDLVGRVVGSICRLRVAVNTLLQNASRN